MDWERAYADALESEDEFTVVAATSYPMLLLPDSIMVEGEPDELAQRIIEFRYRHPAIAAGEHVPLVNSAYAFLRSLDQSRRKDAVIVVLGASGRTTVNVSRAFADDALLRDAMTGRSTFVSFGLAIFDADPSGIILIEEID